MAFEIPSEINFNNNLKIICRKDSAIPSDLTEEEWKNYSETLDESILRMIDKPTRFVFKSVLDFDSQVEIQSKQFKMSKGESAEFQLGAILEEFRRSLIGIENPDTLPSEKHFKFIREIDGYASKEMCAKLKAFGAVEELYAIRTNVLQRKFIPTKK